MSRQVILNFHGLGEPGPSIDADERPYWVSAAMFEDLVARTDGRADVLLTFDDGNISDLEIAAPILKAHARTAWIYVLTGRLDQPGYLTPADVRTLRDMGMRIGLHGRDHVDWRAIPAAQLDKETVEARQVLADIVDDEIDTVSIPFGAYNRRIARRLETLGYKVIFTTDGGAADETEQFRARTSIRSDMRPAEIDAIVAGELSLPALARRSVSRFLRRHVV